MVPRCPLAQIRYWLHWALTKLVVRVHRRRFVELAHSLAAVAASVGDPDDPTLLFDLCRFRDAMADCLHQIDGLISVVERDGVLR